MYCCRRSKSNPNDVESVNVLEMLAQDEKVRRFLKLVQEPLKIEPPLDEVSQQMGAANGKGILENSFTVQREREMNLNDFINVGISILRKQSTQSKMLKMALKDLVEARQAFVACDPNGNGQVEAEEMETVMKIIGVKNVRIEDCKQLVELLDLDGNGMIDWREFVLSHNSELVISDKNAYGIRY